MYKVIDIGQISGIYGVLIMIMSCFDGIMFGQQAWLEYRNCWIRVGNSSSAKAIDCNGIYDFLSWVSYIFCSYPRKRMHS